MNKLLLLLSLLLLRGENDRNRGKHIGPLKSWWPVGGRPENIPAYSKLASTVDAICSRPGGSHLFMVSHPCQMSVCAKNFACVYMCIHNMSLNYWLRETDGKILCSHFPKWECGSHVWGPAPPQFRVGWSSASHVSWFSPVFCRGHPAWHHPSKLAGERDHNICAEERRERQITWVSVNLHTSRVLFSPCNSCWRARFLSGSISINPRQWNGRRLWFIRGFSYHFEL